MPTTRFLLSNVPFDCSDTELRHWIEDRGFHVSSVTLIRDVVSGTSPSFAHVRFAGAVATDEAIKRLNGQILHNRVISVTRVVEMGGSADRGRSAGAAPR